MKRLVLLFVLILLGTNFAQNKIRIISYNIHHAEGIDGVFDLQRIADLIKEYNADLVALQEVDKGTERTTKIDIADSLGKLTGMHSSFYKNIDFQGGEYGNAILSKGEIICDKNLHYVMLRDSEQRGLLQTKVVINGDTLVFMNTHIDYREDDGERLLNVGQLVELVKSLSQYPIIVCGDFNDLPNSRTITAVKSYFSEAFSVLGMDSVKTFSVDKPERKIDYIFFKEPQLKNCKATIKVNDAKVLNSNASDHLPIYAELELIK